MAQSDKPLAAQLVDALSHNEALDGVSRLIGRAADPLAGNKGVKDVLGGDKYLGHPLHPALVHFPLGGAFSAAAIDLFGAAMRPATIVLTGLTAASALPTAASGLVEWHDITSRPTKRLGTGHAGLATVGTTFVTASLLARLVRRHKGARLLLWGACAAYGAASFLGGHLVYNQPQPDSADPAAV